MIYWIKAVRLRTLPLSITGILIAASVAQIKFNNPILLLSCLTACLLQILANLANDYGDWLKGADIERKGEERMVSAGKIKPNNMLKAIISFTILSFISAISLIFLTLHSLNSFILFFCLIILVIVLALAYTLGKKPYGYVGLGDLVVYLCFGPISVLSAYFLLTNSINWWILMPANSIGLFCVCVINLNNIRDINSDLKVKKITIANILGIEKAKLYQLSLILLATLSVIIYSYFKLINIKQYVYLISMIGFINLQGRLQSVQEAEEIDTLIKPFAFNTFLFSALFYFGNQ